MNYILLVCMLAAIIHGIYQGLNDIQNVRKNPKLGIPESNNIFSFLFTDKY